MKESLSKLEFLEKIEQLEKDNELIDSQMIKPVVSSELIELFKIRLGLQEKILNILNEFLFDSKIIRNNQQEDIKFLKEYREFMDKRENAYPLFIFGEYEKEKFSKCLEYIEQSHTLDETEDFYALLIIDSKRK